MFKTYRDLSILQQKGFTLLEALIVSSILAFGFVASNKAQVNIYKARQSVTKNASATLLTAQEIEEIRNYSSLTAYNNIASSTGTTNEANTDFNYNMSVTTQNRYKQLNLNVNWVDGDQNQTMVFTNYISASDPQISGMLFGSTYNTSQLPSPGSTGSGSGSGSSGSGTGTGTGTTDPGNTGGGGSTTTTTPTTRDELIAGTNITLTYNALGEVTQINHNPAVSLSGSISLASGAIAPSPGVSLANITINVSTTNSAVAYCSYSSTSGGFSCYMARGWSGKILLAGISSVKVCVQNLQPYSNLLNSLNDQNYLLIKSNKNCPTSAAYLLQSL